MTRFICPVLLLGVGCVSPELGEVEQAVIPKCDDWGCGMNSPEIDQYGFHDVPLDGSPNAKGFSIKSFELPGGTPLAIDVEDGRVFGTDSLGNMVEGSSLTNSVLTITHDSGREYLLKFVKFAETEMWTKNGGVVPSYEILWLADTGRWENMCHLAGSVDPEDLRGMNTYDTVIFEGERIDAKAKTIEQTLDTTWINFGCAGSTLAKLHLTGHTQASRKWGAESTTIEQRQAILKMFSGDYCGTGKPFTVAGTALQWMDDTGQLHYDPSQPVALEARWGSHGASCLNKPRVIVNPNLPLAWDVFGSAEELQKAIANECNLDPCRGTADDTAGFHLNSANPS